MVMPYTLIKVVRLLPDHEWILSLKLTIQNALMMYDTTANTKKDPISIKLSNEILHSELIDLAS